MKKINTTMYVKFCVFVFVFLCCIVFVVGGCCWWFLFVVVGGFYLLFLVVGLQFFSYFLAVVIGY